MKKQRLNYRLFGMICIFMASLLLAVSMYVVIGVNADDAGSYMWLYRWKDLGAYKYTLKEMLDPWRVALIGVDFMGLGNTGAETVSYCFSVLYFICVLITLLLAMKNNRQNGWLLMCAIFMLMPSAVTNKYHLPVTMISLLIIYIGYNCVSTGKKGYWLFVGILFMYSLIFSPDRVLILLFILAPIVLYLLIACFQDKKKRKYLYFGGLFVIAVVSGAKVVDEICRNISGHGLTIMEEWGGYGGGDYLMWIDVYNLFDKGIPSFFQTLLNQFNIPANGGLIQYNTFFWFIRMFMAGMALVAVGARWREIVKRGILNVNALDAFSTVCVTVVLFVNVLNGIIEYFPIEEAYMNRYASIVWFLLVVILIRWIDEHYISFHLLDNRSVKITSGVVLGVIFALLIVGYSRPIYKGRDALVMEPCQNEVDYLRKKGDLYSYGIASYWKSSPISAITDGEYIVLSGWIDKENTAEGDILYYLNRNVSDPIYMDGSNFFNYIISHTGSEMTIDKDTIEVIRGDYIDMNYVGNGESVFYRYDYDIRFDPVMVMQAVGEDYELTEPIVYCFDMPVGINRIDIEAGNSRNLLLEIEENDAIGTVEIHRIDDDRVYVDVQCLQNTKVELSVARKEDELTTLRRIILKRVLASVTMAENVSQGSYEVFLEEGDYVITFEGEAIDDMKIEWGASSAVINQSTDGSIRRRYSLHIDVPQTVRYTITGGDISIEKISYENADLFNEVYMGVPAYLF